MSSFINILGIFDRVAAVLIFGCREPFGVHRTQLFGCPLLGRLRSPNPLGVNQPNLLQNINKSYHKN